ncbi:hypothetical protein IKE67_01635 [bacterium]|nr:hypothetical protein [bacterium]
MGMSTSQVRLLALTSRMNDLEYKAENIANIKVRLADESDKIAQDYTKELGKQRFVLTSYSSGTPQQTYLTGSTGDFKLYHKLADGHWHQDTGVYDSYTLYEMIQSGEYIFRAKNEQGQWEEIDISTQSTVTIDSVDNATLAQAEAKYNAATSKIHAKEKELDRQQSKLDTEHEALKTERDSLKEIIRDNVDNTFKLFG